MPEASRPVPRVLVAAVMHGKSRSIEELSRIVVEEVKAAPFQFVRSVVVRGERDYIQQLVSNVSNDNEADAIVMVGGTGFGPYDEMCEAIDTYCDRHIEGFGAAYRRLLRDEFEFGAHSWLVRATAGVYNKCIVMALTGRPADVKRAVQTLIIPTVSDAVELATGRMRPYELRRKP
jgi:molybdenum cofactor biosynthesis protein B